MVAVVAVILLGAAFATGYGLSPEEEVRSVPQERPEKWQPKSHEEMLRACGVVCGERNVKEYNAIRGKCTCKD